MAELSLRPARRDELELLSVLCLSSKAIHGYDQGFLDAARDELTLTEDDLEKDWICVAEVDGTPAGVAQVSVEGEKARIGKLFVKPGLTGNGIGSVLFDAAIEAARERRASSFIIESDPGAVAFYRSKGARADGETPSGSIPGRMLPRLVIDL